MTRFGIPERLMTDNGRQFSSDEFAKFCRTWEIEHVTSSPFHPRSNGLAEKAVGIAKSILQKSFESGGDYRLALMEYHNTPRDKTLGSPAERLMSRRCRTSILANRELLAPHVIPNVVDELSKRRKKSAEYADRHSKELPALKIGDKVLFRKLGQGQYTGTIVKFSKYPRSYIVQEPNGKLFRRNRQALKKAPSLNATPDSEPEIFFDALDDPTQEPSETPQPAPQLDTSDSTPAGTSETNVTITRSGRISKPPDKYVPD